MNRVSEEKSVRALLKSGIARLREAQVPSYTLAAELLLLHVLSRDRTWIYSHPEEEISAGDAERFRRSFAAALPGNRRSILPGSKNSGDWNLKSRGTC